MRLRLSTITAITVLFLGLGQLATQILRGDPTLLHALPAIILISGGFTRLWLNRTAAFGI